MTRGLFNLNNKIPMENELALELIAEKLKQIRNILVEYEMSGVEMSGNETDYAYMFTLEVYDEHTPEDQRMKIISFELEGEGDE